MAKREIEIIEYDRIEGLNMFMNTVDYRTPHQHGELELIWNLTGVLHVGSPGGDRALSPGSIILINREVIHEFRGEEGGATFLCMQLDLTRFKSTRSSGQILFDAFLPEQYLSGEEMTAVRRDILSLFETYLRAEPDYGIYCASMAGLILYRLLKAMPH
ncbi:MAG: AraC family ligand binding domain-containing protein, partial [Lachnospiraceae bacterium]|nr:AraC family ligand binding domain-containing protein [Lachnospiraceae bacterium]